jgi:hypothetical protein
MAAQYRRKAVTARRRGARFVAPAPPFIASGSRHPPHLPTLQPSTRLGLDAT